MAELLFDVRAEVCDCLNILSLTFLTEILAHLVWIELWGDVGAVIDDVVCVVSLLWVSGVVAVVLSKESKNCA